ncbi:MAG: hypothetical protein EBT51_11775 [Flavobacteriaceae bacterium]|jgi:hypothetical protein|nr:hypothetical protein [Flavobacteriaceae bacterium]
MDNEHAADFISIFDELMLRAKFEDAPYELSSAEIVKLKNNDQLKHKINIAIRNVLIKRYITAKFYGN